MIKAFVGFFPPREKSSFGFRNIFLEAAKQDSEVSNSFHGYERKYYSAGRYLMAWRID